MAELEKSTIFNKKFTDITDVLTKFYKLANTQRDVIIDKIKNNKTDGLSAITNTIFTDRPDYQKTIIATASNYYYAVLSAFLCPTEEKLFYEKSAADELILYKNGVVDQLNGKSKLLKPETPLNDVEAFSAGFTYSVVSSLDIVSLATMVSQLGEKTVTKTIPEEVNKILNYPSELKGLYDRLKNPTYTITPEDIVAAQPPASLTPEATIRKAVVGASKFLYNHYGKEGNYWRGGDLTAQIFPIAISGGALLGNYLGKWKFILKNKAGLSTRLSKMGKIFRMQGLLNEDAVAAKLLAGAEIESVTLTTSTGTEIEQTLLKNETNAIDNIYEEVNDPPFHADGQRNVIKISGLCLAQNTKVFGSNQTIAELSNANSQVQTLEKDGSVSVRKVLGKYSRKVSDYVKVFVGGEELKSSSDHEFKTNKGWFSAGSLRKGMMLFSLALNSFVPVDSMAFINEPLQVEGLALGNVEGYGVGSLGILVAPTRAICFEGFTDAHYAKVEATIIDEVARTQFYNDIKTFTDAERKALIASVDDAERVAKAWDGLEGLADANTLRKNINVLKSGKELIEIGFSKTQFKTLASLQDLKAFEIAKKIKVRDNVDFQKLTDIINDGYVIGTTSAGFNIPNALYDIATGNGQLRTGYNKIAEDLNNIVNNGPLGMDFTLSEAGKKVKAGNIIEIENGHADLEDFTLSESYQQKLGTGSGSQVLQNNLASATNQLRGSGGELPTFTNNTIAQVKLSNSANPFFNSSESELLAHLKLLNGTNVNYSGVKTVIIENGTGKHIFDVVTQITN